MFTDKYLDQHPILTRRPEHQINVDGLDMMIGHTTQELVAMLPVTKDPSSLASVFERLDLNFPRNEFIFDYDTDIYQAMSTQVKEFYFPRGDVIDAESASEYVDLFSDNTFSYIQHLLARTNSKNGHDTYFYRFGVVDELNMAKIIANVTIGGAAHADELCYIFRLFELYSNK